MTVSSTCKDSGKSNIMTMGRDPNNNCLEKTIIKYDQLIKDFRPCQVYIMNSAANGNRALLDGWDVGITSIGENYRSVCSLHNNLQIDISLPENGGMMLG